MSTCNQCCVTQTMSDNDTCELCRPISQGIDLCIEDVHKRMVEAKQAEATYYAELDAIANNVNTAFTGPEWANVRSLHALKRLDERLERIERKYQS